MSGKNFDLPEYPVKCDMWEELKREARPIVIYGMGNGADKLIARFSELNIEFTDVFASNGFVRGHSFHGIRVKSFSEIRELYSDFVIVLSFASNREEVLSLLSDINEKYDMYIPDMPVAGEAYFDSNFYNTHYEDILSAYNALSDTESKKCFASVVNYKLTGRLKYLMTHCSTKDELYALISSKKTVASYVDGGAYNGDTLKEAIMYFKDLKRALLIEPDKRSFKKLSRYTETLMGLECELLCAALWSSDGFSEFTSSGNRNSSINSTASYQNKLAEIKSSMLDSVTSGAVDYIKYDVEGAELEALMGSDKTIKRDRPVLLVSAYHRSADVFSLINYLKENYPFYDLYLKRLRCVPAWELDIIAIPKE